MEGAQSSFAHSDLPLIGVLPDGAFCESNDKIEESIVAVTSGRSSLCLISSFLQKHQDKNGAHETHELPGGSINRSDDHRSRLFRAPDGGEQNIAISNPRSRSPLSIMGHWAHAFLVMIIVVHSSAKSSDSSMPNGLRRTMELGFTTRD
jgi:hypothetical protein